MVRDIAFVVHDQSCLHLWVVSHACKHPDVKEVRLDNLMHVCDRTVHEPLQGKKHFKTVDIPLKSTNLRICLRCGDPTARRTCTGTTT